MENLEYYQKVLELSKTNQPLWQVSIIRTDGSSPAKPGMKMIITSAYGTYGNLGGGEMEHAIIDYVLKHEPGIPLEMGFDLGSGVLADKDTGMICGGSARVFIEPLYKPHHLYIIGAGHCGKALGQLAKQCGFWVHLVDNREQSLQQCSAECYHQLHYNNYSDISQAVVFGANSWIVIMTHGHAHDKEVLQQCLKHDHAYLGMIGSKSKVAKTFEQLEKQGFDREILEKVHAPIGLNIYSQSPQEIAVSIMAEIILKLRTVRTPA